MNKNDCRKKLVEIKMKIAMLPVSERTNKNHPYFQELLVAKKEYLNCSYEQIMLEKESEKDDKHKRR